jgi:hypothetical protein
MKHLVNIIAIVFIVCGFFWWVVDLTIDNKVEQESPQLKTKHYESEETDEHRKMKIFKHQTWYGDTMLITIDTTYFYIK